MADRDVEQHVAERLHLARFFDAHDAGSRVHAITFAKDARIQCKYWRGLARQFKSMDLRKWRADCLAYAAAERLVYQTYERRLKGQPQ